MGASELVRLLLDSLNEEGRAVGLVGQFDDIRGEPGRIVALYRGFAIPVDFTMSLRDMVDEAREIDRA